MKSSVLQLVGYRFQVLFHSPPGVLFTFPSRYFFTIGHYLVFSLGWWSTQIPAGFLVPDCTQDTKPVHIFFAYRTLTFSGTSSQTFLLNIYTYCLVLQPRALHKKHSFILSTILSYNFCLLLPRCLSLLSRSLASLSDLYAS